MSIDIFSAGKEKVMPEWAKFVNKGDSVQGTYIGKIVGQRDGYGNEQIVYQVLQDDGRVINCGFGLNKKMLNQEMDGVKFGQIIGFLYKGLVTVKDKRTGKNIDVKDYGIFQDSKIVNETWLKENSGDMPRVTRAVEPEATTKSTGNLDDFVDELKSNTPENDVPFTSETSMTNEDKLAIIQKLAKDKLGTTTPQEAKEKVMEKTGIAFIPVNYEKIINALKDIF